MITPYSAREPVYRALIVTVHGKVAAPIFDRVRRFFFYFFFEKNYMAEIVNEHKMLFIK